MEKIETDIGVKITRYGNASAYIHNWWNVDLFHNENWISKGSGSYYSLAILENSQLYYPDRLKELKELLKKIDATSVNNDKISKAYIIHNKLFANQFESTVFIRERQLKTKPDIYLKKDAIKQLSHPLWRQALLDKLESYSLNFEENKRSQIRVIAMIHGTDENYAWNICRSGFMKLSTDNYFGKGIYFTSTIDYALESATFNDLGERTIIVCYCVYRTPYPVIEKHESQKLNYDMHFTVVAPPDNYPILPGTMSNERIKFVLEQQEAQLIPRYVVYFSS